MLFRSVVRMESVIRCAGPVGRGKDKIERGIYRKHCVPCHGMTGNGLGAAAMMLEPYPRDFRRGSFKFKSTPTGSKPTKDDLIKTLTQGIPGTAMPSFLALEQTEEFKEDVDDLVEYVRFLAIRGEVERRAITKHVKEGVPLDVNEQPMLDVLNQVIGKWARTEQDVVPIPSVPNWLASTAIPSAEIEKGEKLFQSELTACVKCHGSQGRGDGASQDYDEWTKDWTILAGIDPKHPTDWKEMKPFGALKPVLAKPQIGRAHV